MEKQFISGSAYFFSSYEDYNGHDIDFVVIDDELEFPCRHQVLIQDGLLRDHFYWQKNDAEWHINYLLRENGFNLDIAHLLIPGVSEYLGITIEQLKQLSPVLDKLEKEYNGKYAYYKTIFDSYIENNSFILTDEQRLEAYNSYKKSRNK